MSADDTITLTELARHAPSPADMYLHLIKHVLGKGERGWFQKVFVTDGKSCRGDVVGPRCGTVACVAGEACLYAGVTFDHSGPGGTLVLSFQGRPIVDPSNGWGQGEVYWDDAAMALGVKDEGLFDGGNSMADVLGLLVERYTDLVSP